MKLSKLFLVVAASLFLSARAGAQLKWEQKEVDLRPSFSDEEAVAHFKYENVGFTPIHFASVRTSCGCTVAKMAKDDVAPHEKGEITASLKIGDRIGLQQKSITVETNDPQNPTTVLMLRATIPTVLEVQPNFVYWDGKEPLKPKNLTLHAPEQSPVTRVTVTSSDPTVKATIAPGPTPKDWIISVAPSDRAKMHNSTLTIKPEYPTKSPKLYYAMARVANAVPDTH